MNGFSAWKTIIAGFVATLVMTATAYVASGVGLPRMDFAAMLGSILSGEITEPFSSAWWAGMLLHFAAGALAFSLIYSYLLYPGLPGRPWLRGTQWGLILWVLSQALVMPVLGMGFFSNNMEQPGLWVFASLIVHVVYGAILGALAGVQARSSPQSAMVESREREHGTVDLR